MPHHCHARACKVAVRPEMLMCLRHWRRVPRDLQQAVWRHYRRGQCEDKSPSEEWHEAADAAIGMVAALEGHALRVSEVNALNAYGYKVKEKRGQLAISFDLDTRGIIKT